MNKIVIAEEDIKENKLNKNIKCIYEKRNNIFGINKLVIDITNNSDIMLDINIDNSKYNIIFNITSNIDCNLYIISSGDKGKIQFTYNIDDNSCLNIIKYDNCTNLKEMTIANLNGKNSIINSNQSGISNTRDVYDIIINHNYCSTNSNINHNLLCFDPGRILLQMTDNIGDNITKCNINNNNYIYDLSRYQCEIKPNLYINSNKNKIALDSNIIKNDNIYDYLTKNISNKNIKDIIKRDIKIFGGDTYQ